LTRILGNPGGGPRLGRPGPAIAGISNFVGSAALTGNALTGNLYPAFNPGWGLNLFGFGSGGFYDGVGDSGLLGGGFGLFNPELEAEKEDLLAQVEYDYLNGTLGPEDLEILDIIEAEEQAEELTTLASLSSLCGGVSNTIIGGCGLPTPFLCYVGAPATATVDYIPTQMVVATDNSPGLTYVSDPSLASDASGAVGFDPQVVTAGGTTTSNDIVSFPDDPQPSPNLNDETTEGTADQAVGVEATGGEENDSPSTTEPTESENKIILANPEDSGGPVSYDLSGFAYTIEPGNIQTLTTRPSWVVTFDRGGDFGQASYTVKNGTFTFTPTEKGWDLVETSYEVTLDNSRNETDFHYLRNGTPESVKAGQRLTVTHKFPHQVLFDRGDGGEPGDRVLEQGTYLIAVDETSGLFDITPAEPDADIEHPTTAASNMP
jgi:hypothetical protein